MTNILTLLGWLAVICGAAVLVWDFITHRVLSRPGLAAVAVGVLLLIIANIVFTDVAVT